MDDATRQKNTEAALRLLFGHAAGEYVVMASNINGAAVETAECVLLKSQTDAVKHGVAVGMVLNRLTHLVQNLQKTATPEQFQRFMAGVLSTRPGGNHGGCDHDAVDGRCWKCGEKA